SQFDRGEHQPRDATTGGSHGRVADGTRGAKVNSSPRSGPEVAAVKRLLRVVVAVSIAIAVSENLNAAEPLFETTLVFPNAPGNKPNYRIPAILKAANGDLLIIAEKRNDGIGDIGNHDIVMKRSRDKGKTWSDMQVVLDDGD